jgi:carbon-monoxide dehydrogenase large subunit
MTCAFTHTNAVDAYRGAGRPEATYLLERLMDLAAHEMGVDPVELRLKNFIPPFDGVNQPGYQTQVALQYDSGNYHEVLRRGVAMLGYEEFRKAQAEAAQSNKLLGLVFLLTLRPVVLHHRR